VFFIGLVGYDFGTEARRDSFKQQMPPAMYRFDEYHNLVDVVSQAELDEGQIADYLRRGYRPVPVDPYNPLQMVAYLEKRPDEARSLIWTLNLELTPVYSIEPIGGFADRVYAQLVTMLKGQSQAEGNEAYVERVSLPAVLSGQSVRLFSGQEVSQLLADGTRGMYSWETKRLIDRAVAVAATATPATAAAGAEDFRDTPQEALRKTLNKLYYEYRNLGITSPDRALNFAATNIFQLKEIFLQTFKKKKTLDRIDVVKSPYCRVDSDCWDVLMKFLDPENTTRAYSVYRFALDVSDKMPVSLGPLVEYSSTR